MRISGRCIPLQKLSNINGKHLEADVRHMQALGKSVSTIKTDLSAIRFFHDQMDTRRPLPSNEELHVSLQCRSIGGVDRSWSLQELEDFCACCHDRGVPHYGDIAQITYHAGLRIHECFRLDTAAAEAALRTGMLTIKGKGGLVRSVREQVRKPGSQRPMTHHGLRHSYAAGQYDLLRQSGVGEDTARLEVSHLLDHGRPDVTEIYLASSTQATPNCPGK